MAGVYKYMYMIE
uniref:Uncharacterized protein n=1 Tax=Arundo donax TaxID=35708 RepID=A0A0A8YA18_ARUDO